MTLVRVQLPAELVEAVGGEEAASEKLKLLVVIDAVRNHIITRSRGAQILGISRWDFEDILSEHDVPTLELTSEELAEQIKPLH